MNKIERVWGILSKNRRGKYKNSFMLLMSSSKESRFLPFYSTKRKKRGTTSLTRRRSTRRV